jgi:hypothetical protein
MNVERGIYVRRLAVGVVLLCGTCDRRPPHQDDGTCDPQASDCEDGQVCELFFDGENRCATPVTIAGQVVTLLDLSPIEGALVQAVDINGAAVGTSGVSDAVGQYSITVPVARDEDGDPGTDVFTLRVQAQGYQEFPTALRPALPIDVSEAVQNDDGWVLESALTTVALIALHGDVTALGSIHGAIEADLHAGLLVVAEGGAAAHVGFSDSEGVYTIFNVRAGTYSVSGYAAGVQLDTANTTVGVGEHVTGVNLTQRDDPLATVSGNVQIVNAPGGAITSVVLAVESTFQEATARGQVPPGLSVGNVTGAFAITNVPDGRYVVLAAFENDNLVRDPDENISGTQIIHIEVPDPTTGTAVTITEGFKITEALAVVAPGAGGPQQVTSLTPTFEWADDSSEDGYTIRVFDAFGTQRWNDEIDGVSGSATVTHTYAGPPLEPGMFYQFRVWSFRAPGGGSRSSISATEDLKGVFYLLGP